MVKKKILVVEDDRNISKLIVYNLQSENYDTNCLYDGSQVVEFVRTFRPDLIVLDLMLPEVDGLKSAIRLRMTRPPKVSLLLCSPLKVKKWTWWLVYKWARMIIYPNLSAPGYW